METFQLDEEAIQLVSKLLNTFSATDATDSLLFCYWFGITYPSRAGLKLLLSMQLHGNLNRLVVCEVLHQTYFVHELLHCCICIAVACMHK